MDEGFNSRFRTVLDQIGSLQRAAELTGMSSDQVAKWRDGKARPPYWPMMILCDAAGMSLDWLAFGRGPAVAVRKEPLAPGLSREELRQQDDTGTVYIPLSNAVASAGAGIANEEEEDTRRMPFSLALLRKHGVAFENARFITARGDSMEPTIADGALVLIDTSRRDLNAAGIFVLVVDDALLIKRVDPGLTGIRLVSDNKAYADEVLGRRDIDRVNVVGKVFWVGGPL
jgi:phage repressor protein C with HTH and peptisase S24 domain